VVSVDLNRPRLRPSEFTIRMAKRRKSGKRSHYSKGAMAAPNHDTVAQEERTREAWRFDWAICSNSAISAGEHSIKGLTHQVRVWRVVRPGLIATRFEARHPPMIDSRWSRRREVR